MLDDVLYRLALTQNPLVTALPASPFDGQMVRYQSTGGMDVLGIQWQLVYDVTQVTYKWTVLGGNPWQVELDTATATSSASYVTLDAGMTVTTPLAGDYYVDQGGECFSATSGSAMVLSHAMGGSAALDADALVFQNPTIAGGTLLATMSRRRIHLGVAASTAILEKAKSSSGSTTFQRRYISIMPIRVG